MIGLLHGILRRKAAPQLLLDVQGVGYELDAPLSTFEQLPAEGETLSLHTHLLWRDSGPLLFAFSTLQERHVFRLLLRVNGIGPRLALAVLSGIDIAELQGCISTRDSARLARLPGIGKKTADRLILDLQDRIAATTPTDSSHQGLQEVQEALVALGFADKRAQKMAQDAWQAGQSTEQTLRQALRKSITPLST